MEYSITAGPKKGLLIGSVGGNVLRAEAYISACNWVWVCGVPLGIMGPGI